MNTEYAQKWCTALAKDPDALADLYGQDGSYTIQHHDVDDHMVDTLTTRAMIRDKFKQFGGANGEYTFTVREWRGDKRWGLIHWDVTIAGATSFRGVESQAQEVLTGDGSTFLTFKNDGTILMDSTFWNDNPIYEQLGVPIVRPHYWKEGFDPAALAG